MVKILGLMTCFNRKEKTLNAINKLEKGNPNLHFDFLITDDNSNDGTKEALYKFSNITILTGNGSLFYSGGMRMAMDYAFQSGKKYDYCMLLNDDVDFYEHAIENLIHLGDKRIWVGPTCDNYGNLSYGGIIKSSKIRPTFKIVKSDNQMGRECDTFNANCVLIPWDKFLNIGNIDAAYSHSLGDFDYGFSAKKCGIDIRVSNQYVGVCCDNSSSGSWRDRTLSRKQRLRLKENPKGLPKTEWFHYLKKNYSLITAIVYSIIPYLRILLGR